MTAMGLVHLIQKMVAGLVAEVEDYYQQFCLPIEEQSYPSQAQHLSIVSLDFPCLIAGDSLGYTLPQALATRSL